jgi:hypothetical protein
VFATEHVGVFEIARPGGLWLAIRLIPAEVWAEVWEKAAGSGVERSVRLAGAAVIVLIWLIQFSSKAV